ncbi:hypothetical protein DH2020_014643 [Rehmannia glutinosa]|uniref:Uncharacterized protein n=1 Tax=Rehmannia glutinosa TaxID=99300 RepID=A0ABR0WX08_REHGL
MADFTRLKDLQEEHKRIDQILQAEAMKREASEMKFEELRESRIIAEFNKLKQTGSYADYVDKFEELKACMLLMNNGVFSEEYFVANFVSGLSEELQSFITMFEPSTLQQTIELGRKQLVTLDAISRKLKGPSKPATSNFQNPKSQEQEEINPPIQQMDEVQMTLHAISGEGGITTMRLYGECGPHKLHILIDSWSTLSFIQEASAKKLGCHLEPTKPLLVKVANGQKMLSSKKAHNFKWKMQGHEFTYSLRLLETEGCDLILGGDWLKSCTPIELDFDKMTFTVTLMGRRVKIQALTSTVECKMISGPSPYKLVHSEANSEIEEIFVITPIAPLQVLDHREITRKGEKVQQLIVKWIDLKDGFDSWEDLKFFKKKFPNFDPWGQGSIEHGGIVVSSELNEDGEEELGFLDKMGVVLSELSEGLETGLVRNEEDLG